MMTRKDYERFAEILRITRYETTQEGELATITVMEMDMIQYFKEDNPNFDEHKFLVASGGIN